MLGRLRRGCAVSVLFRLRFWRWRNRCNPEFGILALDIVDEEGAHEDQSRGE